VLLLVVALVPGAGRAAIEAPWDARTRMVTIASGAALPRAAMAESSSAGWSVSVAEDRFYNRHWAAGCSVNIDRSGTTWSDALFSSFSLGLHVRYFTPARGRLQPWLAAGVSESIVYGDVIVALADVAINGESARPRLGLSPGVDAAAGLMWHTSLQGEVGFEATYHRVFLGRSITGLSRLEYVTLRAQLSYYLHRARPRDR
jgi:hypothetical protein